MHKCNYLINCLLIGISVLMTMGCRLREGRTEQVAGDTTSISIPLKQAKGFTLRKMGSVTVVDVRGPWQGNSKNLSYFLVPAAGANPSEDSASNMAPVRIGQDSLRIIVPLKRVVTLTTTNLHHFAALGIFETLAGLGGGRYVCNPTVLAGLKEGRIREVGNDDQVDVEAVLGLKPNLVFTFGVGNSSDGSVAKLTEASLATVIDGAYMEETPLGRAEWIKFTAAFFGKEARADSLYAEIERGYSALVALASKAKTRPTVLVNAPFGGIWWVPGGRSYVARFLADAGADYLWAVDTTRGSLNLDLEAVLARAVKADYWLNPGDWRSLSEARSRDPRNVYFQSFRVGHIYNNDKIRGPGGGNDFFETGPARPDWILADLISIFHPELLPNHTLRWYRMLEERG